MKRILIYILVFIPLLSLAQPGIINNSLTNPKLPLLYIGIDNEIEITGINNDSTLKLTSSVGEVTKSRRKHNVFRVYVNRKGNDTLTLFQNNNIVYKKVFEIRAVGDPIGQIGNISDSNATIREILSNPAILVTMPGSDWDHQFRVTSFSTYFITNADTIKYFEYSPEGSIDSILMVDPVTLESNMVVVKNKEERFIETINGNAFPGSLIQRIKTLKKGSKIVFHKIRTTCPGCANRSLKPIVLTIIE